MTQMLGAAPFAIASGHSAQAQSRVTLPIATWGSPTHINIVEFLKPLEAELAAKSAGRIVVQHFPAGQLANDADMAVAVPTGKVKIGWTTLALWSGLIPDVRVGDVPSGLTMAQFGAAIGGPDGIKAVLDQQFQQKAAKILAITDLGPVVIVSNKQIKAPSDLKGVRIRVFSEGTAMLFREIGAAPLQIPFGDIYQSLQKGTIDAALIGFPGVKSQRMYEITKFLLIPASFCGTGLQGYVANLPWWNGIAESDRKLVSDAVAVAEASCQKAVIADREVLAKEYAEKGMTVTSLSPAMPEYKQWAEATAPVLDSASKTLSPAVIRPVRKQLDRA
jgi:TRAP-type C4-dicarboxylate transport system substrate-binding protein